MWVWGVQKTRAQRTLQGVSIRQSVDDYRELAAAMTQLGDVQDILLQLAANQPTAPISRQLLEQWMQDASGKKVPPGTIRLIFKAYR